MRLTIASAVPLVAAITFGFAGCAAATDDHVIVYPSSDTIWYMTDQTHHVVWNPSKLPGTPVNATLQLVHPDLASPIPLGPQVDVTQGRYSVRMPEAALKHDDVYQVAMIVDYLMASSEISTPSTTENTGTMTTAADQNTMTTAADQNTMTTAADQNTATGTSTATMEKRRASPRGVGGWAKLMHLKRKADQTPPYHPGRDTTTDGTTSSSTPSSSSSATDSTTTATTTDSTTTATTPATTTPATTTSATSSSTSPTSTSTGTETSSSTNTNTSDTSTCTKCTTTGAPSTISPASTVTSMPLVTATKFYSPKFTIRAHP